MCCMCHALYWTLELLKESTGPSLNGLKVLTKQLWSNHPLCYALMKVSC